MYESWKGINIPSRRKKNDEKFIDDRPFAHYTTKII